MVDQDSRTLVESVPQGWFHTALLPSGERLVTYFTDVGTPWAKQATSREGFLALIQDTVHMSRKLETHGYTTAAKPQATDARTSRLERFHGEGWLAAGDAGIALDPLSSQGILSALYSGLKAGKAVIGSLSGDRAALLHYEVSLVKLVYPVSAGSMALLWHRAALARESVLEDQKGALRSSIRHRTLRELSTGTSQAMYSAHAVTRHRCLVQIHSKARRVRSH